ncbi:S1C family serine protease [Pseudoramibacter porci]|uniref:Serine protease n=1 Tax=Pseudoramibacter porci TaxID=2606631 RepID=A0A7X2NGH5_9FIRM|nr:S1C family serine protease [Pseudoramibacter porci]MSS20013.1 serine protease [Pseudoramibacter porci]
MTKHRKDTHRPIDTSPAFQNDLFPEGDEKTAGLPKNIEGVGRQPRIGNHSRSWWFMMDTVIIGLALVMVLFTVYSHQGMMRDTASKETAAESADEARLKQAAGTVDAAVMRVNVGAASGTGFAVTTDGMIMTAAHLVTAAGEIQVTDKKKKRHNARLIWSDADLDLALIKISGSRLKPALLSDDDQFYKGETVMCLGRSGKKYTMNKTTILNPDANVPTADGSGYAVRDLIQLDATSKNSLAGSPLCDSEGQIIGMTVKTDASGTYALPAYSLSTVLDQVIMTGAYVPRTIGITGESADQYKMRTGETAPFDHGIAVLSVAPGSGAEKAGIAVGDVITSVDGKSVNNPREMAATLADMHPGSKTALTVHRAGAKTGSADEQIEVEVAVAP